MSPLINHRVRFAAHRNCGGSIHAVFICNATLFCVGKGGSKEQRHEAEEGQEIEEVSPV
jgi:hypothetical protein